MRSEEIQVKIYDRYVLLTLNKPDTLNAFTKELIVSLNEQVKLLASNKEQKALVITGKGNSFSSGGNLNIMKEFTQDNKGEEYIQSIVPLVNELIILLLEYSGPTLAILNGPAVGGGFNLAMACDFRIAHENAKFRMGFTDIGLTPATGNSFFLTKILGIPKVLELSLFSEPILAKNMLTWGLLNEIYTDDSFEIVKTTWLNKICSLDPWQVVSVRRLLYNGINTNYKEQLALELQTILQASERDLFKERVDKRLTEIQAKKS